MEVRVESVPGYAVPPGCYVGVRVGDVLKQGRYEPQRCYHFPSVERRRNAKIDVYRHVGSCVVAIDPEVKTSHEVAVGSSDPTVPAMRLNVNVQGSTVDAGYGSVVESKLVDASKQRESRTRAVKSQAKGYLAKHNIEGRLSDAVKALLKEQPDDPTLFLCKYLVEGANLPASPVGAATQSAKSQPALVKPFHKYYTANCLRSIPANSWNSVYAKFPVVRPAKQDKDIDALRSQARNTLLKAREGGGLAAALSDLKGRKTVISSCRLGEEGADTDALRNRACETLAKARGDKARETLKKARGDNQVALRDLKGRAMSSTEEFSEIVGLRNRARDILVKASGNGGLAVALKDVAQTDAVRRAAEDPEVVSLRNQARDALVKASGDGSMAAALKGIGRTNDFAYRPSVGTWLVKPQRPKRVLGLGV